VEVVKGIRVVVDLIVVVLRMMLLQLVAIVQITPHDLLEAIVQTSHHLQEAVQIKNLSREIPFSVMAANPLTQIMMIIAEVQQLISQKDQIVNHF
jgi:hypothetical protein